MDTRLTASSWKGKIMTEAGWAKGGPDYPLMLGMTRPVEAILDLIPIVC